MTANHVIALNIKMVISHMLYIIGTHLRPHMFTAVITCLPGMYNWTRNQTRCSKCNCV